MSSVPFRFEPKLQERLEKAAQEDDRSATEIASDVIKEFLDAHEFKRAEIEKALIEADKGIFISQEAMHRWIDSWDTDDELPPPEPDIFPAAGGK